MAELERTFRAPVVEAYGMTEAAHQMASNPLPPLARKPGSVGLAAGPAVAIMEEVGERMLPAGSPGEIVVQGPNVMTGYLHNPDANARAFTNGWFRTGDQGILDAVTFAMPDLRLGEEVAAAVVLKDPAVSPGELQRFAAQRLADFKVPRKVLIVDEIPKGPTGKLQRIGLAATLGLDNRDDVTAATAPPPYRAPQGETEQALVALWSELLRLPQVEVDQPFLDLGGDSMLATQLVTRIQRALGVRLSVVDLFDAPTVAEQAVVVETLRRQQRTSKETAAGSSLKLLRRGETRRPPLFLVPGGGGGEKEFLIYTQLLRRLDGAQTLYGFYARGLDGVTAPHTDVAAMAADYLEELRAVQPHGPYLLAGECIGGKVAFEMARLLPATDVALLLLMNTDLSAPVSQAAVCSGPSRLRHHWNALGKRAPREQLHYLWENARSSPLNPLAWLGDELHRDRHRQREQISLLHTWQRGRRPLLLAAVLLMAVAAVHRLHNEFGRLLWDQGPSGAVDLIIFQEAVHLWCSNHYVYKELNSAVYPPVTYLLLWPQLGWPNLETARILWAVTTGAAAIVGRLWTYHRWYDDMLILLAMVALFRAAKTRPDCGYRLGVGPMLAAAWMASLAPASFLVSSPPLDWLFATGQTIVWLSMLLFLHLVARRQVRALADG